MVCTHVYRHESSRITLRESWRQDKIALQLRSLQQQQREEDKQDPGIVPLGSGFRGNCCCLQNLVGGDSNMTLIFPKNWECHNPNWLSYFSGLKPPTRNGHFGMCVKNFDKYFIRWYCSVHNQIKNSGCSGMITYSESALPSFFAFLLYVRNTQIQTYCIVKICKNITYINVCRYLWIMSTLDEETIINHKPS